MNITLIVSSKVKVEFCVGIRQWGRHRGRPGRAKITLIVSRNFEAEFCVGKGIGGKILPRKVAAGRIRGVAVGEGKYRGKTVRAW